MYKAAYNENSEKYKKPIKNQPLLKQGPLAGEYQTIIFWFLFQGILSFITNNIPKYYDFLLVK